MKHGFIIKKRVCLGHKIRRIILADNAAEIMNCGEDRLLSWYALLRQASNQRPAHTLQCSFTCASYSSC